MASSVEKMIRSSVTTGARGIARAANVLRTRRDAHPYLSGIHAPLGTELTLTELAVEGALPAALDGRYLRIGPNPLVAPNPATHHWFVGDGMVHGLRLQGGKAQWYRNRWIRSDAVAAALGEAAVAAPPGRTRGVVNTNVIGHAGRTYAMVEAGTAPVALAETLETRAYDDFEGTLAGPYSAHPHRDPLTGELHAVCYRGDVQDTVWHTVVDAAGRVVREEPIPVRHGPSIHDCALTARFVVVLDLPVTFSMALLLAGHPFPYRWNPAHAARVGLLPRAGSAADIRWYAVDPCYVFHTANAFEREDGSVVVDVVAHDRMFDDDFDGPGGSHMSFERWTLAPAADAVARHVYDRDGQEFPRIDERRTGRPYRYAYCMAAATPAAGLIGDTRLFRHDLESGARAVHEFGPGRFPGEFVFVPRTPDGAETDGWLLGLVVDMNDETTTLSVLDADDFSGPPLAQVRLPHRIPPGFHGNWVPAGT
ncbi:MAG: carotenoid oxygenase family protein [Gammaproteobacteria bacterium]